jgi:hypothetical protein
MSLTVEQLEAEAQKHVKVELSRLSREVSFIDQIDTTLDFMIGSIVDDLMTKLEPNITQHTNLPEDKAMVESLVVNALYKAIDPSLITGISDIVNRRPGEIVGQYTGSSSVANLIGSISNRVGSLNPRGISAISRGSFEAVEEVPEEVFDLADQLYNKIFNVVGLLVSTDPSLVPQFAMLSVNAFSSLGTDVNGRLSRFTQLSQSISTNAGLLDGTYYAIDQFAKTETAKAHLEDADVRLVQVRTRLINLGLMDEYRYGLAQQDVSDAADVLAENGNANNKIQEILGAIDELDYIIIDLIDRYNQVDDHLAGLKEYMDEFENRFSSNSALLGVLNNIQSELRSIISSMEAVLAKNQASIMTHYERRWWMQLLALVEKMGLVPSQVSDYFTADPNGYISDYNTNIAPNLQTINLSALTLLQGQLQQLKYWVARKLESDIAVTPIVDVVNQITSDNTTRINDINNAISIGSGYSVPVGDMANRIVDLLIDTGMDKAEDLFTKGNWEEFFGLDSQSATYLGSFEKAVRDATEEANELTGVTLDGLKALNDVHRFVRNQKRSRDVLATTFSAFKDFALAVKVNEEIPEVQKVLAKVQRYVAEVS